MQCIGTKRKIESLKNKKKLMYKVAQNDGTHDGNLFTTWNIKTTYSFNDIYLTVHQREFHTRLSI